jgi:hypothetical protein
VPSSTRLRSARRSSGRQRSESRASLAGSRGWGSCDHAVRDRARKSMPGEIEGARYAQRHGHDREHARRGGRAGRTAEAVFRRAQGRVPEGHDRPDLRNRMFLRSLGVRGRPCLLPARIGSCRGFQDLSPHLRAGRRRIREGPADQGRRAADDELAALGERDASVGPYARVPHGPPPLSRTDRSGGGDVGGGGSSCRWRGGFGVGQQRDAVGGRSGPQLDRDRCNDGGDLCVRGDRGRRARRHGGRLDDHDRDRWRRACRRLRGGRRCRGGRGGRRGRGRRRRLDEFDRILCRCRGLRRLWRGGVGSGGWRRRGPGGRLATERGRVRCGSGRVGGSLRRGRRRRGGRGWIGCRRGGRRCLRRWGWSRCRLRTRGRRRWRRRGSILCERRRDSCEHGDRRRQRSGADTRYPTCPIPPCRQRSLLCDRMATCCLTALPPSEQADFDTRRAPGVAEALRPLGASGGNEISPRRNSIGSLAGIR